MTVIENSVQNIKTASNKLRKYFIKPNWVHKKLISTPWYIRYCYCGAAEERNRCTVMVIEKKSRTHKQTNSLLSCHSHSTLTMYCSKHQHSPQSGSSISYLWILMKWNHSGALTFSVPPFVAKYSCNPYFVFYFHFSLMAHFVKKITFTQNNSLTFEIFFFFR